MRILNKRENQVAKVRAGIGWPSAGIQWFTQKGVVYGAPNTNGQRQSGIGVTDRSTISPEGPGINSSGRVSGIPDLTFPGPRKEPAEEDL